MGRNRRKRKRRPSQDVNAESTAMSRRQRRAGNRTGIICVAVLALALVGITWHLIDDVSVDLIVYLPEDGGAAGTEWVADLRGEGFHVHVIRDADPDGRRHALHVPEPFSSEVSAITVNPNRYVISGYVPPSAIRRVLREQRPFDGLGIASSPSVREGTTSTISPAVWGFWRDGHRELFAQNPAVSYR